jgi:hypothetical protein
MTEAQIRHRRRTFDNRSLFILVGGIPVPRSTKDEDAGMCRAVAKVYHLAVRVFGPGPDRAVPPVDNGHYQLLTPLLAGSAVR